MTSAAINRKETSSRGVWRLYEDGPVLIEYHNLIHDIILVPTEDVLLLIAELPDLSRQRSMVALPCAIEKRIACPLEDVHVALGIEISPGSYLTGIVAHDKIKGWLLQLAKAGLEHATMIPDALRLPIPLSEHWSVEEDRHRVIVRDATGAGFATSSDRFPVFWKAAGSPKCTVFGPSLSIALQSSQISMPAIDRELVTSELNLRQGPYAIAVSSTLPKIKRVALAVVSGILIHTAIAGAGSLHHEKNKTAKILNLALQSKHINL